MDICEVLGVPFCVADMEKAIEEVEQNIDSLKGKYICFSNVHTTIMAGDDPEYMQVQRDAAYVFADGKPISKKQRGKGFSAAGRVAGPDFMGEMFKRGGNIRHFFYGASEETIGKLQAELAKKYPELKVSGFISPPFRKLTDSEDRAYVDAINSSGADILWVGLGAPKQEIWMHDHVGRVNAVMMGVGAGFDFHAGTVKRAPKWMQKLSLEWLYRMFQDPRRLFKRYIVTNTKYMHRV
ncbi:MAG: WecB/TagA/CpsF family glycosyltransferase, partial [Lachnospiraceae bacterium]|nr:WecB/TagA/CpsF family glycosyltransferase [Candidatus Merdinaster equi]